MIQIRKSKERGHFDYGWLKTFHTFSFATYYDPNHMGFHDLRVINEDSIQGGGGFEAHSHRDMEILTYILEGAVEHKDSMGNGSVIYPGEAQRMTAGTGVTHSEFNHSKTDPIHLLQIWILPEKKGLSPGYEQKKFSDEQKKNRFCLIASRDGREGSVKIHQDVNIYSTLLDPKVKIELPLDKGRFGWVQLARGKVSVNDQNISAGDGASIEEEKSVIVEGNESSEMLFFDLA